MGEASLHYVIRTYLIHYHMERHHQGLSNHLITPEPDMGGHTGRVIRREHLGGCCPTLIERQRDSAHSFITEEHDLPCSLTL